MLWLQNWRRRRKHLVNDLSKQFSSCKSLEEESFGTKRVCLPGPKYIMTIIICVCVRFFLNHINIKFLWKIIDLYFISTIEKLTILQKIRQEKNHYFSPYTISKKMDFICVIFIFLLNENCIWWWVINSILQASNSYCLHREKVNLWSFFMSEKIRKSTYHYSSKHTYHVKISVYNIIFLQGCKRKQEILLAFFYIM